MLSSSSAVAAPPLSSPAPYDEATLSEQPGLADAGVEQTKEKNDLEAGTPIPILVCSAVSRRTCTAF